MLYRFIEFDLVLIIDCNKLYFAIYTVLQMLDFQIVHTKKKFSKSVLKYIFENLTNVFVGFLLKWSHLKS